MKKDDKQPRVVNEVRDFSREGNDKEKAKLNEIAAKNNEIILKEIKKFQKTLSKKIGKSYLGGVFMLAHRNEIGDVVCLSIADKVDFVGDIVAKDVECVAKQLEVRSKNLFTVAEGFGNEIPEDVREDLKKEIDDILSGLIGFFLTAEEAKEWEEKGYIKDGLLQMDMEGVKEAVGEQFAKKNYTDEEIEKLSTEMKLKFLNLRKRMKELAKMADAMED